MNVEYVVLHTHAAKEGPCFFCGTDAEEEEDDLTVVMAMVRRQAGEPAIDGAPVWECCLYEDEAELRDNLRRRGQWQDDYAQSLEVIAGQGRWEELEECLERPVALSETGDARHEANKWRTLADLLVIPAWPQNISEQGIQARSQCAACQSGGEPTLETWQQQVDKLIQEIDEHGEPPPAKA